MGCSYVQLNDVIKDIAAGPFGSNLKVSCFTSTGFPVIDGANLKGFKVSDNLTKFVTEDKARSLSRSIAKRGDVVVTISGTLGQIAYVPEDSAYKEYLCSQRQFRVSFDASRVYVPYLVFYFHTRQGQAQILSFANQTGVPALSQPTKNFRKLYIPLPSIQRQRQIAHVIETINSAIELNDRTNDYLAALCEAIASREAMANGTLSDICFQVADKVPCTEAKIESYVSTESLLTEKGGRQKASSLPTSGKVTAYKAGDTLISNIRPYFKKIWFAEGDGTCSGDVIVFRANKPSLAPYLYAILRSDQFFDYVMAGAKGTKMPRGDKKQMMSYAVNPDCPNCNLAIIASATHRIGLNNRESRRLSNLRDSLLPKLMSGEIDVSKVEFPTPPNNHLYAD